MFGCTQVPVTFKNILTNLLIFGTRVPFLHDPSPSHGGLSHALQGTYVGLYPQLSFTLPTPLPQPVTDVH